MPNNTNNINNTSDRNSDRNNMNQRISTNKVMSTNKAMYRKAMWNHVLAILIKEFIEMWRDKATFGTLRSIFLVPARFSRLFGLHGGRCRDCAAFADCIRLDRQFALVSDLHHSIQP